jgi:hypothetical protein
MIVKGAFAFRPPRQTASLATPAAHRAGGVKSREASAAATVGRYRNGEKGNRQSPFPFSSHRGSGFAATLYAEFPQETLSLPGRATPSALTFLPPAASMSPLGGGRSAHLDYGFNAVSGTSFGPPYPNGRATEAGGTGVC